MVDMANALRTNVNDYSKFAREVERIWRRRIWFDRAH